MQLATVPANPKLARAVSHPANVVWTKSIFLGDERFPGFERASIDACQSAVMDCDKDGSTYDDRQEDLKKLGQFGGGE